MIGIHPIPIRTRLLQTLLATLLFLITTPSYANPVVTSEYVEEWLDQYVIPSYLALHQANLALQGQAHELCDQVSLQALDEMQPYLNQALEALAYSQAIDGGPMQGDLRNFQLYYWPDRTSLVTKQLGQLLDQPDLLVLQEHGLRHSSVALTGYPSLERLLYMPHYREFVIRDQQGSACQYIVAVSDNLVRLTAEITDAWENSWRRQLLEPGNSGSLLKEQNDQVRFVFTNIDVLLTKIISKKLAKPLASSVSKAKPKRLESWRSGHSLIMLKANVRGLKDSLNLSLKPALIESGGAAKWQKIRHELSLIDQQLDQLPTPLVAHLDEPKYWQATQQLQFQFTQFQALLQSIYPSLNVQLGFNAYDGD